MLKLRKNKKGFTLVELIVVIAIMAVLAGTVAGVTVAQLNKQTNNTAKTEVMTFVSDFRNFMIDYKLTAKDVTGLTAAIAAFKTENSISDDTLTAADNLDETDKVAGEHEFYYYIYQSNTDGTANDEGETVSVTFYCKQKGNNESQKPTATYTYSDSALTD